MADDLVAVKFEFVSPYDVETEWEDDKTTQHFMELYNKAYIVAEVVFDDFYAYQKEE